MSRKSPGQIKIKGNVKCLRVYPTENTKKNVEELKTVGIKLSKEQAIHLARVLLAASQDWEEIDITAYRFEQNKTDGTYYVTVTSFVQE